MLLYCKLVIGKNYALFEVKFFRLKFGGCKESDILHVWPTPSLLLDYTFWPTTGLHLLAPTHPGLHPPGLHFRAYTSWPPPLQHGLISWPCIQYPVSRLQYNGSSLPISCPGPSISTLSSLDLSVETVRYLTCSVQWTEQQRSNSYYLLLCSVSGDLPPVQPPT